MNRLLLSIWVLAVGSAHAQTPPAFPPRNVPATFYGTVVDDPYRALEDVANPEVAARAKGQAEFARRSLEAIPGYGGLRRRIAELDEAAAPQIGWVATKALLSEAQH